MSCKIKNANAGLGFLSGKQQAQFKLKSDRNTWPLRGNRQRTEEDRLEQIKFEDVIPSCDDSLPLCGAVTCGVCGKPKRLRITAAAIERLLPIVRGSETGRKALVIKEASPVALTPTNLPERPTWLHADIYFGCLSNRANLDFTAAICGYALEGSIRYERASWHHSWTTVLDLTAGREIGLSDRLEGLVRLAGAKHTWHSQVLTLDRADALLDAIDDVFTADALLSHYQDETENAVDGALDVASSFLAGFPMPERLAVRGL